MPERFTDTFAGECGVRVPVELADKLAAVPVSEVEGDVAGVELKRLRRQGRSSPRPAPRQTSYST